MLRPPAHTQPSRHLPTRRQEPTTTAAHRNLPRRHRAEDTRAENTDRPEPADHRLLRGLQRCQQIPPPRSSGSRHRDIDTGADRDLQQHHPDRSQPPTQPAQPAPHRRRRHPQPLTDRAVTGTRSTGPDRGTDHLGGIRPPQQHHHRQQHMRGQTRPAPRPPRTQRPRKSVNPPPPSPPPRPQRLLTPDHRAGDLPPEQPRLDQNRISPYRHHDASVHQHGPPGAGPPRHIGGRAVVVYVGAIVPPSANRRRRPPPTGDTTKITRPSATRTTSVHPLIGIRSDGQHRAPWRARVYICWCRAAVSCCRNR